MTRTLRAAAAVALVAAAHALAPAGASAQGTSVDRPLRADSAGSAAAPAAAEASVRPARARTDRNALSREEIEPSAQADALGIVRTLRPAWLRTRGTGSLRGGGEMLKVYVDGRMTGGVESLRQVPKSSIRSLRFIDGGEATQRWGTDHGAGVIQVVSM